MPVTTSKFIVAMLDAIMLAIPNVNQAIITAPAIAVDTTGSAYFTTYNALKRLFLGVRHYFDINFPLAYKDALAWNSAWTKVGFIYFDDSLKRFLMVTPVSNFASQFVKDTCDRSQRNTSQFSSFGSGQI